ncbi:hypothetical protein B0O80DRAFT_530343 [Mortierella sp. GBAus27b]|nr:hypothetical protein B0O80DRAFT_530343 [Mortierella sp. GBAus27b]
MGQHHHALNLPEVLFQIGCHLDSLDDVVACSLVCKSFRASFEPFLWINIHLGITFGLDTEVRRQEPMARSIFFRSYSIPRVGEDVQEARRDRILQGFQRRAPWIQALSIWGYSRSRQLRFGGYTGINTLYGDEPDNIYCNDCETLLMQNLVSLRSLTLLRWGERNEGCYQVQPLLRLFTACAQHPNLTTLRIQESEITRRDLEALWGVCRQLEILELSDVEMKDTSTLFTHSLQSQVGPYPTFQEQVSMPVGHNLSNETSTNSPTPAIATTTAAVRLPKLRELTLERIDMDSEYQLEQILLHCPLLKTLIWRTDYSLPFMERFCEYFAARTWPCLDWIEINNIERYVTDQEHAILLQSAPRPFRRLYVNISSLEEQTFNLYRERGHIATLTKIDLTRTAVAQLPGSDTLVSKQVQEVLESCPMLEHIVAGMLNTEDIIQGRPWVCHQLRIFEVPINSHEWDREREHSKYSEDEKNLCRQIFERLGQLNRLTSLNMGRNPCHWSTQIKLTGLPFRLKMGLGYLSTLKNLKRLEFHGSMNIRIGDVEWMMQHWKNLRMITGDLTVKWTKTRGGEPDERTTLVIETLRARGVRFMTSIIFGCSYYDPLREVGSEDESESEDAQ